MLHNDDNSVFTCLVSAKMHMSVKFNEDRLSTQRDNDCIADANNGTYNECADLSHHQCMFRMLPVC